MEAKKVPYVEQLVRLRVMIYLRLSLVAVPPVDMESQEFRNSVSAFAMELRHLYWTKPIEWLAAEFDRYKAQLPQVSMAIAAVRA